MSRARLMILSLAMACYSARPEIQPQDSRPAGARSTAGDCAPSTELLPSDATADGLAGKYRVRIVATAGAKTGAVQDARLLLRPVDDSLRRPSTVLGLRDSTTRLPLSGSIELDPAAVGAARTGDLLSLDPLAPGVLVLERHPIRPDAPAEIMLRLGSDANRRGVVRYDGGYFALTVRRIGAGEFAGTWASGVATEGAEGYFCAKRAGPAP
ncbi:MAG: hypothetical protein E6J17_08730 [Chloroflexi bacterium]|nr:MAG: hypothetical protein E6J17_08730 [Chloroflexota bacterium]